MLTVVYAELHETMSDDSPIVAVKVEGVWHNLESAIAFALRRNQEHADAWQAKACAHRGGMANQIRCWICDPQKDGAESIVWIVQQVKEIV